MKRSIRVLELMGTSEPAADLVDYVSIETRGRGGPLMQNCVHGPGQIVTVDVFHGEQILPLDFAELEDTHYVRVMQFPREPRLVHEHGDELSILGEPGKNAFNDHLTRETTG